MAGNCPPLALLVVIELDRKQIERLHPLYQVFYRLDALDQQTIIRQVRRLQAACPDLSESDCLEVLAAVSPYLEVTRLCDGWRPNML